MQRCMNYSTMCNIPFKKLRGKERYKVLLSDMWDDVVMKKKERERKKDTYDWIKLKIDICHSALDCFYLNSCAVPWDCEKNEMLPLRPTLAAFLFSEDA